MCRLDTVEDPFADEPDALALPFSAGAADGAAVAFEVSVDFFDFFFFLLCQCISDLFRQWSLS